MFTCLILATLQVFHTMKELAEQNTSERAYFDVTGCVLCVNGSRFSLGDETGRGLIDIIPDLNTPLPGALLRVAGYTWFGRNRYRHLFPTNIATLGISAAPPPRKVSLAEVARGDCDYLPVSVRGVVADIHLDELQANNRFLTLRDGPDAAIISLHDRPGLSALLGAEIAVTGLCSPEPLGWRLFATRCIGPSANGLSVLRPAPADRLDVPPLGNLFRITPQALSGLGYRHVTGVVRAIWQKNHVLVETGEGYDHHITALLAEPVVPPAIGSSVRIAGLPETDLFSVTLNNAVWRPDPEYRMTPEPSTTSVDIRDMLGTTNRIIGLHAPFHGSLVRLTGLVGPITTADASVRRFPLVTSDGSVVVDASGLKDTTLLPEQGSRIAVTGVAILETEPWRTYAKYPSVKGFSIVLRTPADIETLARPPWWTTGRLFAALCALFAVLVGILVWNRALNRLVERRSRELLRERFAHENADLKFEERTRLAVELHDSLSQNLEGVACQISATRGALTAVPEAVGPCLDTAERMLGSCRTELRRCLFDLRGDALEAKNLNEALHRTLDPLALQTELNIDCPVRTSGFDDAQVHAILCIIRELVTNAVRHGQAKHVRVGGTIATDTLSLAVEDNGCGFDPAHRPGPDEGHFGLQGVHDRLRRLNGTFSVRSKSGGPTVITVTIPIAA